MPPPGETTTGPRVAVLTNRECEVVRELAQDGACNRMIAHRLHITEDTVKSHLKRLKTGCNNRTELVVRLFRERVILQTVRPGGRLRTSNVTELAA